MGFQRLDHEGMADILTSAMRAAIDDTAEAIADQVRAQGVTVGDRDGGPSEIDLPVEVDHATTDRAKAFITLAHPAGMAVEAKHGVLTKAAASLGLEVRSR